MHLAHDHDFSRMAAAARGDRAAVDALGAALAGTGRPLVVAGGTLGLAPGRVGTEQDVPDPSAHPRVANARVVLDLAGQGVRSVVVRFAPTVHGPGDRGFVATLTGIARRTGVSGYVGDGANRWPAVHRPAEHFGWIGMFFGADAPVSSIVTRAMLGWKPSHATLLEDLDAGLYAAER